MLKGFVLILLVLSVFALPRRTAFRLHQKLKLKDYMPTVMGKLTRYISEMAAKISFTKGDSASDEGCLEALEGMLTADSELMSKIIAGSFKGLNDLGDYTGCIASKDMNYILLMVKFETGTMSSSTFGICGPAQCDEAQYTAYLKPFLNSILLDFLDLLDLPKAGFFQVNDDSIRFVNVARKNAEMQKISPIAVILLIIGGIAVAAAVICTALDYRMSKGKFKGEIDSPLITSCSIVRNLRYLLYQKNTVDPNLEALNGVRVLSMCWVICGHTFDFANISPIANLYDIFDAVENNYAMQLIVAGTFSIDVFFFMSGFLCALVMNPQFGGKLTLGQSVKSVIVAYIHRYIRLLPLYLIAIFVALGMTPYLFSEGPMAVFNEWQQTRCQERWWQNMIYVQNFYQMGEGCLIWSWYLANDMQFFLITPILILIYNKSRTWGLATVGFLILCSVLAQTFVISHYDLSESYFYDATGDLFEDYYVKPYCRIATYLMGILVAWMYFSWKKRATYPDRMLNWMTKYWMESPYLRYTLYFVGIAITYTGVILQYVVDHYWQDLHQWHNIVHIIVSRPVFVIGLLLVLYPALLGKEKIINSILCAPFWSPLAKITYGAYLFHVLILIAEKSTDYHSFFFTPMRIMFTAMHVWLFSYGVSFVLAIFIEIPVGQIEKSYLFPRRKKAVENFVKTADQALPPTKSGESFLVQGSFYSSSEKGSVIAKSADSASDVSQKKSLIGESEGKTAINN